MRKETHDIFEENVTPEPNTGCHLWTGPFDSIGGYGKLWVDGVKTSAHRQAAKLAGLAIAGKVVRHSCDNGQLGCVNPRHLLSGTQADNMHDKKRRGRAQRGEGASYSVLTEDSVRQIRRLCSAGVSQKKAGEQFGVTQGTVYFIVHRKTWAHVV